MGPVLATHTHTHSHTHKNTHLPLQSRIQVERLHRRSEIHCSLPLHLPESYNPWSRRERERERERENNNFSQPRLAIAHFHTDLGGIRGSFLPSESTMIPPADSSCLWCRSMSAALAVAGVSLSAPGAFFSGLNSSSRRTSRTAKLLKIGHVQWEMNTQYCNISNISHTLDMGGNLNSKLQSLQM